MGSTQKYSLRWNDFNVNVASTFRDLHSRQDFVDVTLACSDGSTLDAHKVILSSVSSYFRDILKNAPCKHPIIILKDTCREEATAMLEFAYTGEVNVGQDLLPGLLHTARCFKIKGLDNVQTPPGLLDLNASHSNDHESEHWPESRPPTRPHTPSRPPTRAHTPSRPPTPSTRPHTPQTRSHTPSTRPHSPQSVSRPHSPNSVQSSLSACMEQQPPPQLAHHHSSGRVVNSGDGGQPNNNGYHHHHHHLPQGLHQVVQQHSLPIQHSHSHLSQNSSSNSLHQLQQHQPQQPQHLIQTKAGFSTEAEASKPTALFGSPATDDIGHQPQHSGGLASAASAFPVGSSSAGAPAGPQPTSEGEPVLQAGGPPTSFAEHFMALHSRGGVRSQPATRPSSPVSAPSSSQQQQHNNNNSRTPPPKRWKRSFDMARVGEEDMDESSNGPGLPGLHSNGCSPYPANGGSNPSDCGTPELSSSQDHHQVGSGLFIAFNEIDKRSNQRFSTDSERRFAEADSASRRFAEPRMLNTYPHSMPASPTMMDPRNINSLGFLRHLSRVKDTVNNGSEPREAHENSKVDRNNSASMDSMDHDALDYRFQSAANAESSEDVEKEKERQERLAFRPESAPTVLDMSPEASRHCQEVTIKHEPDDRLSHFRSIVGNIHPLASVQDSISDCFNKSLNGSLGGGGGAGNSTPNSSCGSGRYSCDECGKLFRHPGSLQHHRHIHRGTHKCPSCGKAFSRRWDMERHLKKSKFGCPANRYSSPGVGSRGGGGGRGAGAVDVMASPHQHLSEVDTPPASFVLLPHNGSTAH